MIKKADLTFIRNAHRSPNLIRAMAGNTADLRHLKADGVVTVEYDENNIGTLKLNQHAFEEWMREEANAE